jgi:diguanylate cyclase (GGDEF)-like protein/PAS domain S-box-containing protein
MQVPPGVPVGEPETQRGAVRALGTRSVFVTDDAFGDGLSWSSFVWDSLTEYAVFTLTSDGVITSWNSGAEHTFGYPRSEIVGRSFATIFTPEDIADGAPALELRTACAAGRIHRDCWHVRRDRTRFWGTNTVQPLVGADSKRRGFMKIVRDSTERYEAAITLRQSEERFRLLVESVVDHAIFSTGPDGRITLWNAGAERTFGYAAAEIIGESFAKLFIAADVDDGVPDRELAQAREHGFVETERWQVRKDGTRFVALRRLTLLRAEHEGLTGGFAATAHDVTERRATEQAMWDQAFHDALTGLPNRALLVEHLNRAIARTKRDPRVSFAVLYLDLENFKAVNDDFGHLAGDKLLKEAAHRIQTCVRPEDVIARFGGDEFTILLRDTLTPLVSQTLARRIHRALSVPFSVEKSERVVTASIGVVLGSPAYDTPENVLRDADAAMYEAKGRGLMQTVIFDDGLRERDLSRQVLEVDVRGAIDRDELFLEYQPIVSLHDLRVAGFEALLRWRHPQRGVLQPADFIPIAERTGAIVSIDRWVLLTACRRLRAWQTEFPAAGTLTMSVNMSAKQFTHAGLPSGLEGILRDSGAPGNSVKLEITETATMERTDAALAALAGIRALGIEIHVDDFGTGYSSLSYLGTFPVNALKLDRSFIAGVDEQGDRREIARAIVALAHKLRLTVVAEGVETLDELRAVQALACDFAQGFLFHAPLDADAARDVVAAACTSAPGNPRVTG